MTDNILKFPDRSRKEVYEFGDGKVTIEVLDNEPPLTVSQAIYMLSNVMHQIHRMMEPNNG